MTRNQFIGLLVAALAFLVFVAWLHQLENAKAATKPATRRWHVTVGEYWVLPGQDVDEAPFLVGPRSFDIEL